MASFLGTTFENTPVQSKINAPMIQTVLSMKQGQYDATKQKLQAGLDQLEALQVLRPQDSEYIQAKINSTVNSINDYSNLELTPNVEMDLTNQIKSVARDPFIINAIENTTKYRNFNLTVDEIRKKKPELYSDVNYSDALDQGGYQEYMQGKTNKIGNLEYHNYIDAPKVLNESVAKWAKDYGYKTTVNSINKGLYFVNEKKQVLTKSEIVDFIKTNIDPNTKKQLEINARATYGKLPDDKFNEIVINRYKEQNTNDNNLLVEARAMLSSKSGKELELLKSNIDILETNIEARKTAIEEKKFSRDSQYEFYNNDLFNGIASNYDKNEVIDIDYNTVLLDVAKYQEDVRHNKASELLEAYKLDGKNSKGEYIDLGTEVPVVPEDDPNKEKPNDELIRNAFVESEAQLKRALAENDPEYKKLTTLEERNNYVRALMKSDGTINLKAGNAHSQAIINARNNHKNNYKIYGEYINSVSSTVDRLSKEQYDDMLGGKNINLNNLAETMPNTAKLLKGRKDFNSLTAEQQEIVRYERVANQLKYDDSIEPQQRRSLTTYLNTLKKRNSNNSNFLKTVSSIDTRELTGFAPLESLGSGLKLLFQDTIGHIANVINDRAVQLIYGEEEYKKSDKATRKAEDDAWENFKTSNKRTKDFLREYSPIYTDSDITEIDTSEDTKSGKDLSYVFRNTISKELSNIDKKMTAYLPTMPEKSSYSFSTDNKLQEANADILKQVVIANIGEGVPAPNKVNDYNVEYTALTDSFKITYLVDQKDGDEAKAPKKQSVIVTRALMPKIIREKYNLSQENWATSNRNPKGTLPSFEYNPPYSKTEGKDMINTLSNIASSEFTPSEIDRLSQSLLFQTPSIRFDAIYKNNPVIKNDKNKQEQVNKVVNANVVIENKVIQGQGFRLTPVLKYQDGTEEDITEKSVVVPEYDPQNNLKLQMMLVSEALDFKVKEITER